MKIAVIGTGKVGGTLGQRWHVLLGARPVSA